VIPTDIAEKISAEIPLTKGLVAEQWENLIVDSSGYFIEATETEKCRTKAMMEEVK
jgi:hypothetical protein